MPKGRIISKKYWSHFIDIDSKTNRIKHNGLAFEKLVFCLLEEMYSNTTIKWKPTQTTHDGNKDFKALDHHTTYWAECKNYKTTIDLKALATTLVMAEIENVNVILFFCYSSINKNTKTKLCSFSKSTNKTIYFYDGNLLDQLILKYKEKILPEFFPEFYNDLSKGTITYEDKIEYSNIPPTILCYVERNPFLDRTCSFSLDKLDELQYLQLGEIIAIHLIATNNNLDEKVDCIFEIHFINYEKSFEILDEIDNSKNDFYSKKVSILPGETIHQVIFLKLQNHMSIVSLPEIKCKINNKEESNFCFGMIRTLRTRQIAFIGQKYLEKKEYLCKKCINAKELSVIFVYGGSGTGKSRMLQECMDRFISAGYQVIKFSGLYSENATIGLLQELIFSLYGFTDELIEHIIQNHYEEQDLYTSDKYDRILKILKIIYNNKDDTISNLPITDYFVIFEKLANTKCFILIDDIQYWPDEMINFIKNFIAYAHAMQRNCSTVIAIAANTDVLHRGSTIEFLSELNSNNETYRNNIHCCEITGFDTEQQSFLFINEVLGTENINLDLKLVNQLSCKPKYLTEVANYLLDVGAVTITNNRAIVGDTPYLKQCLSDLPKSIHDIIDNRWKIYLRNCETSSDKYKLIISCILLLESVDLLHDSIGEKYSKEILKLSKYGFLKKKSSFSNIYLFEHDIIKTYFQKKYYDWMDVAISYCMRSKESCLKSSLNKLCEIYEDATVSYQVYIEYMSYTYSNNIRFSITEKILRKVLEHNTENSYLLLQRIFNDIRENFGEQNAEYFYQIFMDWYNDKTHILSIQQYCTLLMEYAENQLKLKNTLNAISLYEKIISILDKDPFENSRYYLAQIYNRWFVCGRVGSYTQEFLSKLNLSMQYSKRDGYHDLCIENHFDIAQSLMIDINKKDVILQHLKAGCDTYELYEPERLRGQYLYRCIQIDFIEGNFSQIEKKIQNYEYIILTDKKIIYKLFFRIHFLIFKIMLCLMEEIEYSDFEINNLLETLNLYQTMQNPLQLYRCYYLYGKYYTKKHMWDEALLFYKKTLDNLDKNTPTEEIYMHKRIIFEDMLINFKKNKFPFEEDILHYFQYTIKELFCENIIFYSEEDFEKFFNKYNSPAIISTDKKEGYLLF